MQGSALTIDLSQVNGSAFVKLEGDIDAHSAGGLRDVLEGLPLEKHVEVDMAGVRFMDSSGLNVFISHIVRVKGTSGSLCITNPSRQVDRVVQITGMANLLYKPRDE